MGYSPREFAQEALLQAQDKWIARKNKGEFPEKSQEYRLPSHSLLISWETIKCNNMLFSKCPEHSKEILSPKHLYTVHRMKINLRILELLEKSKELHAELKTSTISERRKGRIYKLIDEKKEKHQDGPRPFMQYGILSKVSAIL